MRRPRRLRLPRKSLVLSVEEPKADAEVDEVVVAAEATPRAPDDIAVDDLAGDAASPVSPSEAEYEAEFDTADESHRCRSRLPTLFRKLKRRLS